MRVNYYAMLREIVGQKTVNFDMPDSATMGQLIDQMVLRYPRLRPELIDEHGKLYGHVQVFVNGVDLLLLADQMDTIVQPEDVINVFPAIGGGTS